MAINDNGTRNQYTSTASQTAFIYTFEIFDKGDIAVEQNGALLAEGADYTVSGVGSDSGGTVTLTTGASSGDIITLYRDMSLERITDYQQSGDFLASEINNDLDRLWAAIQQIETKNGAGIRPSIDDSILNSSNTKLANVATRGGKALGFANDGTLDYKSFGTAGGSFVDAATTATMTGLSDLSVGDVVQTAEFSTSNGGGGVYDVVLTSSVTPNGANIIQGVSDTTISFVLRVGDKADFKQFGGTGDDSTNNDTAFDLWLDYLIANDVEGIANDGIFVLNSATQKTINGGLKLSGNATFKAGGSNRANMIRFTGCQGLFSMDGLTINGNDISATPFRVENESSTATTQGNVYIGSSARFINAKNNSPDTNTVTGCLIRGGFSGVIFEGEIDTVDDNRTSGGVTEGLTVTHFTTSTDDWVKSSVITGKARIKHIKNSNTVLADADGLKVDAPTDKTAYLTVQPGARFEECKGRAIKSQVVKNVIDGASIYRSLYDGLTEINLQYSGGIVCNSSIHHNGTRTNEVIGVTERLTPSRTQCLVVGNELSIEGSPSSDTRSMVQFNVTDAAVISQGATVRDNRVVGSIEHMYRWIIGNQVGINRAIVVGNWAETISGSFIDLSVQGTSPAQPNIILRDNGCRDGCTGATGGSSLLVEDERNNHNITTAATEPYELTIAGGVIDVYAGTHKLDTESNAASDDLDTINTSGRGQDEWLTLKLETSSRTVTIKHATGNIRLDGSADFTLSDIRSSITLAYNTSIGEWNEIARVTSS